MIENEQANLDTEYVGYHVKTQELICRDTHSFLAASLQPFEVVSETIVEPNSLTRLHSLIQWTILAE